MIPIRSLHQAPIAEQLVPFEVHFTSAQTDQAISPTIAATERLLVHGLYVSVGKDVTVNVALRIGFAAATLTAVSGSGVAGILATHSALEPGAVFYGLPGLGAAGQELRFTCGAPTTGAIRVNYLYEILANQG